MLGSLLGKSLRDQRLAILGYGIGLAAFAVILFAAYPSIKGMKDFQQLVDSYPPAMKAFLGEMGNVGTIEGFLSMELTSFMYPMLLAVFALTLGTGAIAGEEDRGTIDLLMSNPLPRWKIVADKFAVLVLGVVSLALVTAVSIWVCAVISGIEVGTGGIAATTLGAAPLAMLVGAFSLLFSCVLRTRRAAIFAASVVTIAFYFLNTLAPLVEGLKHLQRLSIFYYYSGYGTLTNGIKWDHAGILLGFTLVFFAASLFAFEKREIHA